MVCQEIGCISNKLKYACFVFLQEEVSVHKKKREYRKRKHKASTSREVNQNLNAQPLYTNDIGMLPPEIFSSDEEPFSPVS